MRCDIALSYTRLETYLIPAQTLIPEGKRFTLVLDMPQTVSYTHVSLEFGRVNHVSADSSTRIGDSSSRIGNFLYFKVNEIIEVFH